MHLLTIKVQDNVLDKVVYFLNNLPKKEVEIVSDTPQKQTGADFIENLASHPVRLQEDTQFMSRDEANAR